jgi:hypothetical protein
MSQYQHINNFNMWVNAYDFIILYINWKFIVGQTHVKFCKYLCYALFSLFCMFYLSQIKFYCIAFLLPLISKDAILNDKSWKELIYINYNRIQTEIIFFLHFMKYKRKILCKDLNIDTITIYYLLHKKNCKNIILRSNRRSVKSSLLNGAPMNRSLIVSLLISQN